MNGMNGRGGHDGGEGDEETKVKRWQVERYRGEREIT